MQSPLFGGFGGTAFDDRVESLTFEGITALTIRHGRNIDAIQATYKLPDGGSYTTPQRGGGGGTASTIHFEDGEKIVRISGKSGPSKLIDMLRILTQTALGELKQYGPYGTGLPGPSDFTVTGAVSGLFGRHGHLLDALGFHFLDPLSPYAWKPLYSATTIFGGKGGEPFDDGLSSQRGTPILKIQSLTIRHGTNIDALEATYLLADGTTYETQQHGGNGGSPSRICFADDEQIIQISGKAGPSQFIDMLKLETSNSAGEKRVYGPYGTGLPGPPDFTINGIIYGFFGRSSTMLDAVGFYV